MDSNLFQLKRTILCKTKRWVLVTWGLEMTYFQVSVDFFLEIPDEKFNLGHMSYLFKMWTQEQVRNLTTQKVIEKHLGLFQIKEHYERQNVDPPAKLLADLQLFIEEIQTLFRLIKIILNCVTPEYMAYIASSMT